ncbi:unnamed protein product [Lampetra planeri]
MDMGTRRRAVWMSVVICILSSIASVHLQASSREYFVAVGQKVTLTCDRNTPGWTQHDNPNIRSITWRRGEGSGATEIDLTNSREARITFTKDVNQHSASIRIANVQHSDAGFYSCLVEREFGTESLKMEIITMEVSAYPSRSVTEGATVTLKCDISNSAYVQSIVWTHGRIEMNKGNSVLTLHKVKRCQEGAWTCGVKPQTDQASASLDLKVSSQNVCEVKEPAPRKYFVSVGQTAILPCVESDPEFKWKDHPSSDRAVIWKWERQGSGSPTIVQYPKQTGQWTRDVSKNTAIPLVYRITALESAFDQDNFSIQISNVQYSDAGLYICHFAGYFRTSSLTRELITMQVSANPSLSVTEGETVTLMCNISNNAYVQNIVWTHGGIEMNKGNSVLTLHKVKRCQEGEWTCGVKTQTDQASASLDLKFSSQNVCEVKEPAPRKYFVSVGQTAILPCVESDPEFKWEDHPSSDRAVIWRWERQGSGSATIVQYQKQTGQWTRDVRKNTAIALVSRITALKSAFDQDSFSIQISNAQYSDAGLYICHFAGYFRTSSLTRELITMQVSANPSRSVTEGDNVTLTCDISNSAYGTGLVWYHGDTYISQGNRLTLNKVKRSQQGQWKCVLHDQHNSHFASYTLEFTSTGSDVGQAPAMKKYFIHEGGEVSLSCDESDYGFEWKDGSQLQRAVTWKWKPRGTTKGSDQTIQYTPRSRDFDNDQFPLTMSNVKFTGGGVYTCEFTGYYRTGTLTMELVTIKVSANPSSVVSEGATVTLKCDISNRTYVKSIVWTHGGIEMNPGNSVLTLNKVKRSQQGQWECVLHDQHNSPFASYTLEFTSTGNDVGQAPAVKTYFIHEGGEVSLSCDESDPGFKWNDHSQLARAVTWKWRSHDGTTKGSDQNLQDPPQSSDSKDQFPLTLSTVTFSRGGVYTCEFTGYYRTGTLIMELVTMKVSSNTSDTVAEGESISLTCQLSNDSYAHMVRWIHNGIEISHKSSLVLVKVKAAQSGLWKCSLKRESGEISEVAYNLKVQKIGAEQNVTRNYAAQIGQGTTLPCMESDPGFEWRSSSTESRSVTWYWRPRGDSTVRTILAAHPAGPHAAFSSHLNSHVNISSSAFDDDDFSLTISVVNESSAGVP